MGQFNDTASVTGGSGQQLSTILFANNFPVNRYTEMIGTELTLFAPAGQSLFVGNDATVTNTGATQGLEIIAGAYDTQRASGNGGDVIDPSTIWLYVATTDNVGVRFRYKS